MSENIFTQYQPPQQQNPLQIASEMQGMALKAAETQRVSGEARQQALTLQAKQALGNIMQKHINPETGEFDHVKAYGEMAASPEIGLILPEVTEQFLRIPGIKAEALAKEVQYHKERFGLESELSAEALRQMQVPGADAKSIALDLISKRQNANLLSRQEALSSIPQLIKMAQNPIDFQRGLARAAQFGEGAQKSLNDAHLGLGYLSEEVEGFDQNPDSPTYGQKIKGPRYIMGGMTPGQAALAPNTASNGQAPSVGNAVRQEVRPSAPPAARLAEPALNAQQLRDYMSDTEGTKHWLMKEETEAQNEANAAVKIETNLHKQVDLLQQFGQGPLMETRVKIAEALDGLGFPQSTVKGFLDATKGAKDPLGAAQLARKYFFEGAANELKTSMPGLQKATNFDVQTALKASPEMGMTKGGLNQYMKNMQNLIDIAKERATFASRFGPWSRDNVSHPRSFNQGAYNQALRDYLTHQGVLKTGPLNVEDK